MSSLTSMLRRIANTQTIHTGELGPSTAATKMPDIACTWVQFRAAGANTGMIHIGNSGSVQAITGTRSTNTGFQLDAGQETEPLFIQNLNKMWYIGDNSNDNVTYIISV